jgi:hypothetical protein
MADASAALPAPTLPAKWRGLPVPLPPARRVSRVRASGAAIRAAAAAWQTRKARAQEAAREGAGLGGFWLEQARPPGIQEADRPGGQRHEDLAHPSETAPAHAQPAPPTPNPTPTSTPTPPRGKFTEAGPCPSDEDKRTDASNRAANDGQRVWERDGSAEPAQAADGAGPEVSAEYTLPTHLRRPKRQRGGSAAECARAGKHGKSAECGSPPGGPDSSPLISGPAPSAAAAWPPPAASASPPTPTPPLEGDSTIFPGVPPPADVSLSPGPALAWNVAGGAGGAGRPISPRTAPWSEPAAGPGQCGGLQSVGALGPEGAAPLHKAAARGGDEAWAMSASSRSNDFPAGLARHPPTPPAAAVTAAVRATRCLLL